MATFKVMIDRLNRGEIVEADTRKEALRCVLEHYYPSKRYRHVGLEKKNQTNIYQIFIKDKKNLNLTVDIWTVTINVILKRKRSRARKHYIEKTKIIRVPVEPTEVPPTEAEEKFQILEEQTDLLSIPDKELFEKLLSLMGGYSEENLATVKDVAKLIFYLRRLDDE